MFIASSPASRVLGVTPATLLRSSWIESPAVELPPSTVSVSPVSAARLSPPSVSTLPAAPNVPPSTSPPCATAASVSVWPLSVSVIPVPLATTTEPLRLLIVVPAGMSPGCHSLPL